MCSGAEKSLHLMCATPLAPDEGHAPSHPDNRTYVREYQDVILEADVSKGIFHLKIAEIPALPFEFRVIASSHIVLLVPVLYSCYCTVLIVVIDILSSCHSAKIC